MDISRRLSTLVPPDGDGWAIHYEGQRLAAAGEAVTVLTVGEADAATPAPILEAMDRAARAGSTKYTPVAGLPELRAHVAARVEGRTGVRTRAENVLITAGGQAALFAAHMAVLDPGETGLIVEPYYATYPGTIRAAGGEARAVATRAEDGFRPTSSALAASAPGCRSLLINTPCNPTGQVYDRLTLARIAAACMEHDLWLVSDEVYETQVWTGVHVSPRSLPGMAERTLVIGSMSKSHAMTGSRVGWLVGPEPVIEALSDLATNTTYGLPGYIQRAALWALEQGETLEEDVAAPFRRRRMLAAEVLRGARGVRLLPTDGGMFAMLDIRETGLSGTAFAEALLVEEGIAVMPGESFGAAAAGHLRVGLTVEDARLEEALRRLANFAASRLTKAAE